MHTYFDLITRNTDMSIVSKDSCKYCGDEFALYNIEQEVLDKQGFKYPDICPTCRFRMLYSYINDRQLYHRKDALSGESIVSILSPNYSGSVIEVQKYKDMMVDDYALEFARDLGENIMDDFKNMYEVFPKYSRMAYPSLENSQYASHSGWAKNLYLSFCVFVDCEDIYYSYRVLGNCSTVFSSLDVSESSKVYSSRMIEDSHNISFSSNVFQSSTLLFCYNMQNCDNCLLSCNKVNAKYMIWNTGYEKDEYQIKKSEILKQIQTSQGFKDLEQRYKEFLKENLVEPSLNIQNSQAIAGDNVYYSNNNVNSFRGIGNHNTVNTILMGNDTQDKQTYLVNSIEGGQHCENVVGCCSFGQQIHNLFFCYVVTESQNCSYCIDIQNCQNCMFSMGLRNKKYCILNKQYSEEQYFEIKEKIISHLKQTGQWGEFLGFDMSTFPYNDVTSYDFWRIHKVIYSDGREQVIDENGRGVVTVQTDDFISDATLDLGGSENINITWRTKDKEINVPDDMKISENIPSIDEVNDDILNTALICEKSGRPFRIIPQELEFLKKKGFPIPIHHHETRMDILLNQRPVGELYVQNCDSCQQDMLCIFSGETQYQIYCPECYQDYMFK